MVANKTFVGGRALSLSITAVGSTGAAEAGNEQRQVVPAQLQSGGVPLLLKSPSFHSGLDRQASGDKFIMYDNSAIVPLPRLHGESLFSGARLHRPYVSTDSGRVVRGVLKKGGVLKGATKGLHRN